MTPPDLQTLEKDAEAGDPGAQFAWSQALERMRRGPEARLWLRRAAEAGHPFAQTLVGARLLMAESDGEAAAANWREGLGFIVAAHEAGVADATTMIAVLTGMGVGLKQSWDEAFDLLQLAAERGSGRARTQLLALAREMGATVPEDRWSGLRAALDAAPWLQAPEPEVLSRSPYIAAYRGFVSPAICAWMVSRVRGRVKRAEVFDPFTGKGLVVQNRSNSAFQFNAIEFDLPIALVRARIVAATGAPQDWMESPQIFNYRVGETFAPHFDFLDAALPGFALDIANRGQRATTVLIYLNDDFEGGETAFTDLGLTFRGETGDALLFRNLDADSEPDPRTRHAGLPTTRGEKWLFSQWIRDRAPNTPPAAPARSSS